MPPVDHFPSTHATWIDAQLTIIDGAGASTDSPHAARAETAREALRLHL